MHPLDEQGNHSAKPPPGMAAQCEWAVEPQNALHDYLMVCRSLSCPEIGLGCPFLMLAELFKSRNIISLTDFVRTLSGVDVLFKDGGLKTSGEAASLTDFALRSLAKIILSSGAEISLKDFA